MRNSFDVKLRNMNAFNCTSFVVDSSFGYLFCLLNFVGKFSLLLMLAENIKHLLCFRVYL